MVRFARAGFATAALIGVLSFSMPVTAMADTNPIISLAGTIAAGGGVGLAADGTAAAAAETGGTTAVAAVCATGVGCAGLAVAAVGIGLYLTHDTWMPWIKNAFGGGVGTIGGGGVGQYTTLTWLYQPSRSDPTMRVHVSTWAQINGISVQETSTCSDGHGGFNYTTYSTWGADNFAANAEHDVTFQAGCLNSASGAYPTAVTVDVSYGQSITWTGPAGGGLADSGTTVSTTVDCANPDGSTFKVTEAVNGVSDNLAPMPTCAGAAGSQVGAYGKCVTVSAGPIGGALEPQSTTCPAAARGAVLYPNCANGQHCTYVIRHNGIPCDTGVLGCVDWSAKAETAPSEYQCWFGPYLIALAGCRALERIYEVQAVPLVADVPNTDGDPRTHTGPAPPNPNPTTSPTPLPTTAPSPSPHPGPGPGEANPVPPSNAQDCFPNGWSAFNPAEWVLQPVKCALKWAFVPSSTFLDGWSGGIKADWNGSPFGHWLGAIAGFGAFNIPSGGCQGPGLPTGLLGTGFGSGSAHFNAVTSPTIYPFAACSGVMATVAATSNLVLTAGISFFGGMRVVQQLGYAFGFKVHVGSEINS